MPKEQRTKGGVEIVTESMRPLMRACEDDGRGLVTVREEERMCVRRGRLAGVIQTLDVGSQTQLAVPRLKSGDLLFNQIDVG